MVVVVVVVVVARGVEKERRVSVERVEDAIGAEVEETVERGGGIG